MIVTPTRAMELVCCSDVSDGCSAHSCMGWRWAGDGKGYCGLAGAPTSLMTEKMKDIDAAIMREVRSTMLKKEPAPVMHSFNPTTEVMENFSRSEKLILFGLLKAELEE